MTGGQGVRARDILVLRECIWNARAVSLVISALDDTGSLGSPPHRAVYPPWFHPFLAGNREVDLKLTTLSSLLLSRVFLSFLLNPQRCSKFECCRWGYSIIIIIYIYGMGGVWAQLLGGGQGARAPVILALREYFWNAPEDSLVLPAFDDIGSLGSPPHRVVYPLGPPWGIASRFLAGNREAELKPTIFSSLLIFPVF